ncbi:MAG: thioredoxin family protein [Pirellulales bacterium]|nr:thioredoxin family protein [Pirellulales bacterium]
MTRRLSSAIALVFLLSLVLGCGTSGPGPSAGGDDKWADHTQGLPFLIGYEAGITKAKAENKPVMLFVTTTWCGWCKKLAAEDLTDPEVRKMLENFVLAIVDGDTETAAAKTLGADGFPHIVFQDPEGQNLGTVGGYVPVADFKSAVEQALTKFNETHPKVAAR